MTRHAEKLSKWQQTVLKITTSNEEFYRCYSQGILDMAALRLPLKGTDRMVFVPAAGLPWFVALFGRDTLIVSLQTMIVYPEFAAGALEVLGQYQATERDDYRDAEPGKILHELRYGELAHFKLIPHTPYYGTADATPLYLIALHSAWLSTGNRALIERQLPIAEAGLSWIDRYGEHHKVRKCKRWIRSTPSSAMTIAPPLRIFESRRGGSRITLSSVIARPPRSSAAMGRSTGSAGPALTRVPALRLSSVARRTDAGSSRRSIRRLIARGAILTVRSFS
jgi:hypothetical protein